MKIGVLWRSNKENEKRYPLHWKHLENLESEEFDKLYFEKGYPDLEKLKFEDIHLLERNEIFSLCDMIILPKPTNVDLEQFKDNQILWGWPHAVQGYEITDYAMKKNLTLIAWENMYIWEHDTRKEHVFSRNNEMAGYAAVNHFMELLGITPGVYGEDMRIAVLGYGSTAKGSINSLLGLGATDITVYSKRTKYQIADAIKGVKYKTYSNNNGVLKLAGNDSNIELLDYDLILNCILQNPLNPITFLKEIDMVNLSRKKLIIDISCDRNMGFEFATPTSFENPLIITKNYIYYAVDHTPTYYWNAASYEISGSIFPYLKYILKNNSYKGNIVLEKAVDIENGIIINTAIKKFQNRK